MCFFVCFVFKGERGYGVKYFYYLNFLFSQKGGSAKKEKKGKLQRFTVVAKDFILVKNVDLSEFNNTHAYTEI